MSQKSEIKGLNGADSGKNTNSKKIELTFKNLAKIKQMLDNEVKGLLDKNVHTPEMENIYTEDLEILGKVNEALTLGRTLGTYIRAK